VADPLEECSAAPLDIFNLYHWQGVILGPVNISLLSL